MMLIYSTDFLCLIYRIYINESNIYVHCLNLVSALPLSVMMRVYKYLLHLQALNVKSSHWKAADNAGLICVLYETQIMLCSKVVHQSFKKLAPGDGHFLSTHWRKIHLNLVDDLGDCVIYKNGNHDDQQNPGFCLRKSEVDEIYQQI